MTIVENLPQEVLEKGLFCVWRREERDGKPTKVPYNPRTGGGARSCDPATFAPLAVALAALEHGEPPYAGLGVGIFGDVSAIDLDRCIDSDGSFSDMAADIMVTMNSYTEKSPSGTGLRILFKAGGFQYDKAKYYINNQGAGLEVYIAGCTNKYVTITGDVVADCGYEERGPQLQGILEKYMVRPVSPFVAAHAVYDLLAGQGCTPACIGHVVGDYTIDELRDLADTRPEVDKEPEIRCMFFDPVAVQKPE